MPSLIFEKNLTTPLLGHVLFDQGNEFHDGYLTKKMVTP
jgi:hypothetical protein